MKESIAISIVTYNSTETFKTLENLAKEILPHFKAQVFLFDNHSDENFRARLKTFESEKIQITYHTENTGFGFGHNYNARLTDAEYLVVCNPDILIDRESFQLLLEHIASHPETAFAAPKVLNPDGSSQYLIRQKLDVFDYMLRFIPFKLIKKIFDKRLAFYECREITERDTDQEILFASGCFMFYRKADFDAVKGFDERFFMYFEDNDICQKTRKLGKKIMYLPHAKVVHFYSRDSHKSGKVFSIFMRSMKAYFDKWGWRFF